MISQIIQAIFFLDIYVTCKVIGDTKAAERGQRTTLYIMLVVSRGEQSVNTFDLLCYMSYWTNP